MMRRLSFFLLLMLSLPALAVTTNKITATVTITNAAGTTNGQTITVNGNVRTFTNNVVLSSVQVLTNALPTGSKTNLYAQIGLNPFAQVTLYNLGPTNFQLVGASALPMAVTLSAGVGTVSYATQVVATAVNIRVPYDVELPAQQTNVASEIVRAAGSTANTNAFAATATAVSNLVNRSTDQTVAGVKRFTASGGLNGYVGTFTNGVFKDPVTTNLVNYGNAISSPGSGASSEQFGVSAVASAVGATALGSGAIADGPAGLALGQLAYASAANTVSVGTESEATATNSTAVGTLATASHTNSSALGYGATTTRANQTVLGSGTVEVLISGGLTVTGRQTNSYFNGKTTFDPGADVSFGRYALSSLANGNNAGIVVGTNVFVEVSGPSAAFTINGIAGGRDGKVVIILNQTSYNMTIAHDSGTEPTAANRIYTMTAADRATTGNGAAMLIYNAASSRWILFSLDQ